MRSIKYIRIEKFTIPQLKTMRRCALWKADDTITTASAADDTPKVEPWKIIC